MASSKQERARNAKLLGLFREYVTDVIAMGVLKADAVTNNNDQARMKRIYEHQGQLHERIQNAEREIIAAVDEDNHRGQ